ncbi:hypothetical protein HDU96_002784 [Phlyctochytrium bullatum]|nr:hypothetical protein HDU96_002784 [Phlyctochytrium bullatum]
MSYAPPPGPPPPLYAPPPGPPPPDALSLKQLELQARSRSLGHFAILPDQAIHGLLAGYLDAGSLNVLSTANKAFYIFSRDDAVWRGLCIRSFSVPKAASPERRRALIAAMEVFGDGEDPVLSFKGTWRLTYYFPRQDLTPAQQTRLAAARNVRASPITPPFFSDFLYRKAERGNMKLASFLPDFASGTCLRGPTISDDRSAKGVAEAFRKRFDSTSTPVLVKGGFDFDGEAWGMEKMVERFGDVRFSIGTEEPSYLRWGMASDPLLVSMTFKDYVEYMKTQRDESPLYIFDGDFGEKAPALLDAYKIPRFFEEDYLSVLGDRRPPFRWVVAGPARSGASWHIDPMHTSAWNALIAGKKRWSLYPPTVIPAGFKFKTEVDAEDGQPRKKGYEAPSALHWFLDVYPMLPVEFKPIEFVQEPGDVIFVPAGWWHIVLNVEEVNVAVTQNFISEANIEKLLAELLMQKEGKKFEELRTLLTSQKPELKPHFNHTYHLFGDVEDPLIKQEGCDTRFEFFESFVDFKIWLPRIQQVWKNEFGDEKVPVLGEVFPIRGGSNPVFLHPATNRILKFYAHLDDGLTTHAVESYVLQSLSETNLPVADLAPKLLRSGRLLGDDGVDARGVTLADGRWSWPFIVMTRLGGDAHIPIGGWEWKVRASAADEEEGAEKEHRKLGTTAGDEAVDEVAADKKADAHWASTVKWLAGMLRQVHAVEPRGTAVRGSRPEDRRGYKAFVEHRLADAVARHRSVGALPKQLLDEIEERLGEFRGIALAAPEALGGDMVLAAGVLHGDMNPGNVLGEIREEVEAGGARVFRPQFVIDFGDAFASEVAGTKGLDALWDLAGTYVGVLKCDPKMLEPFMQAYTEGRWRLVDVETRRRLRHRMLILTLVCGHQGYIRYAVRAAGGTKRLENEGVTWDRLVDELFGSD